MDQDERGNNQDAAKEDLGFMRLALDEAAAAADEGEVPIGAVVVCDGQVVSRAHNRREEDADPAAHAEFLAMEEAARALGRWRLSGCTVYVRSSRASCVRGSWLTRVWTAACMVRPTLRVARSARSLT